MYKLWIEADMNDGDYVQSFKTISPEELLEILPVIEAIKEFKSYKAGNRTVNYPTYEGLDEGMLTPKELYGHLEGFEMFDELIPHGEYGVHTIKSIILYTISDEAQLL